ncbi:MAG: alanine:cation symporter family protein, partial [Candidatus Latescibacteria bacterium]|nr:alanine:cation symporter family protein [Candidatus Latescibacterota bacterium]
HIETIPQSLALIFKYAFTPTAAGGGFLGAVVAQTIRFGVARGIFSNESGLGSAPIAHAAAKTKEPVREGLVAMVGPFADTIIICSMTALVIISTVIAKPPPEGRGRPTDTAWSTPLTRSFESWPTEYVYDPATGYPRLNSDGKIEQRRLTGVPLTTTAFSWGLAKIGMDGVGEMIVSLGVVLFAFSTLVSWSYYGDRSISYLFGLRAVMPYRMIYVILIVVGAIIKLDLVWNLSDVANALMAVPNLVGLLALSGVVANETRGYLLRRQEGELP